ncbi:hypothetical protein Micbo1qcDRAFT_193484 [Microdochium bolleyi]|uniref:DUF8004 domain-containing protein n=1 Tax=Microdochium bolleyi TaxID=196109 RepID=A0A136JAZ9_9PEZI|nr:hypothetical protein Micbo1qcDRAFT_193484 [Microdochium bolleyi]
MVRLVLVSLGTVFASGNCHVHLYGRGQSRRGPAFKLPFSVLIKANCQPLIRHFMSHDGNLSADGTCYSTKQAQDQERVDLYVPAPPSSDKVQAFNYHLATRNFFAFLFRRSVVGANLGGALINLFHSMQDFRDADEDNMEDITSYMDEEGYLECQNQPAHALAMLRFADTFRNRSIYIDALAHCAGMSETLYLTPEYQLLSSATRKLIRRVRTDTDRKLARAHASLSSFLQDELSEAYIGLPSGARAHLERFRTLLHGFFAAKFGYYPPTSTFSRPAGFEAGILHAMTVDFDSLYEYLVDQSFDMSRSGFFTATGGICALQSVISFDSQHSLQTRTNPLPLLPQGDQGHGSKRTTWYHRSLKGGRAPTKAATYIALLNATNHLQADVLDNNLVKAYRRFEEDSIMSPLKADEQENLSPLDGRKVRWILIYAMTQILHQYRTPPEVKCEEVPTYHVCISTMDLPPWDTERPLASSAQARAPTLSTPSLTTASGTDSDFTISPLPESPYSDLKPDVDYFAIHQRDSILLNGTSKAAGASPSSAPGSSRPPLRTSTLRRSFTRLAGRTTDQEDKSRNKRASHHEIVVLGYGNGTNEVSFDGPQTKARIESSPGTSHYDDSNNSDDNKSNASSEDTVASSLSGGPRTPVDDEDWQAIKAPSAMCQRSASLPYGSVAKTSPATGSGARAVPPLPAMKFERRSHSVRHHMPAPLNIRKSQLDSGLTLHMPSPTSPTSWGAVQRRMEQQATTAADYSDCVVPLDVYDEQISSEWEHYKNLGGLTECKPMSVPAPPKAVRRTSSFTWRPRSSAAP